MPQHHCRSSAKRIRPLTLKVFLLALGVGGCGLGKKDPPTLHPSETDTSTGNITYEGPPILRTSSIPSTTCASTVGVRGQAQPGSKIIASGGSSQAVATADASGQFCVAVPLSANRSNALSIQALGSGGQMSQASNVTVQQGSCNSVTASSSANPCGDVGHNPMPLDNYAKPGLRAGDGNYAINLEEFDVNMTGGLVCLLYDWRVASGLALSAALRALSTMKNTVGAMISKLWRTTQTEGGMKGVPVLPFGLGRALFMLSDGWSCELSVEATLEGMSQPILGEFDPDNARLPLNLIKGLSKEQLVGKTISARVLDDDVITNTTVGECKAVITERDLDGNQLRIPCNWDSFLTRALSSNEPIKGQMQEAGLRVDGVESATLTLSFLPLAGN